MTRTVLVPSSLVREIEDGREATRKLGYIARAATVFRIDRLRIYPDPAGEANRGGDFVETVLAYAATPPYLRKTVWGKRDELQHVGVLLPQLTSPRAGSGSDGSGSLRQGIVTDVGSDGRVRVNCGLQHPISLPVPPELEVEEGEHVTVRVSSRRPVRARLVNEPLPGFTVDRTDLPEALATAEPGTRIAASRYGNPLTLDRLERIVDRVTTAGFTVVFGAPGRGLATILDVEPGSTGPGFDCWLNTIPNQGSETVRTEEAMFASLASLTLTK